MKMIRSVLLIAVATLLLSLLALANMERAEAQSGSYLSKTGSALEFLMKMVERKEQPRLSSALGKAVYSTAQTQSLSVSIRFDHELSESEIVELEAEGLVFVRVNGEVAHSGTIYGAQLSIGSVDALKIRADVLRIESTWQPGVHAPLDVSVPEINANDMWQLLDGGGENITGEGIKVANFDTGIDVFHPDFWNADGGPYEWIDTNSSGTFDPGIDAVDLNGNSSADTDETLDFFDAEGDPGNNDGVFQADVDWLYNDADSNGQRDFGTASGFTETDPTFGERLFIVDDTNDNNALDIGENLIALGTSKVLRTLNSGGTERVRGTDLIQTDDDTNGHGTSVCGIIDGGIIGKRKYVGVAPNAELLVADRNENDHTFYIPWARTNGADVMLYEFGGWVQRFLDGSSNLEQQIDAEAAGGIVQVVPAGNLGNKDKHAEDDVAANGSTNFTFNVPSTYGIEWVYITALWRTTGNDLAFTITTPTPSVVNLPATPSSSWNSTISGDGHTVWYRREDSTRGTAKYDISIYGNDVVTGGWTVQVINNSGSSEHVDMYIKDDRTSWTGGALWTAFQSNNNTVTYPATADSAITVASYSTRGWVVAAGDLSTFSPAGPRIDGQAIMDIAAPGNYDIASAHSKDASGGSLGSYRWFSGTSAAGPHVAGGSALLLQWDPSLNHAQVQTMLQQSARTDAFTGGTPNAEWGHGKLDVLEATTQTNPDLVVISPSVSDSILTPGQSFTIYATVKNQGNGSSSSTTLRYYRSTDSTISAADTLLGTDIVTELSPNGTSPENLSTTAPSTDGTYWVGACVDAASGESNTDNNCSSGMQITVSPILRELSEDFASWPPAGWSIINNGGDCVWESNETTGRTNYAGGGGFCADADADECGAGTTMDTELRTPVLNFSGRTSATLSFVSSYNHLSSSEHANVDISTDGGITWVNLLNWQEDHDAYGPGETVNLDLTPYVGSSNVVIRFHYYAPGFYWWWEVDDVVIRTTGYRAMPWIPLLLLED